MAATATVLTVSQALQAAVKKLDGVIKFGVITDPHVGFVGAEKRGEAF